MKSVKAATAAVALGLMSATATTAQVKLCETPKQMQGFKTCANVEKAFAEGKFVQYSTDPEHGQVKLLNAFKEMFPQITTSYVRLQAGSLYSKLLAERQAKSFLVDAIQLSDIGMMLDLQKRGGLKQYLSPEMAAFKPDYKSTPEGFWTWGAIIMAGIAYNPAQVKEADIPKKWEDLVDPKWLDAVNVKVTNSGLQHGVWYVLKPILGDAYFQKLSEVKPRAFDSYVQQYGRLVDGQDKVIMGAQYSGYLEFKAKGAPVAFVFPEIGVPTVSQTWGIVSDGPNPNAAELFIDWLLSPVGQKAYSAALLLHSPREDVDAPAGGTPLKEMKLLFPKDWHDFEKSRPAFAKEWDKITGLRK